MTSILNVNEWDCPACDGYGKEYPNCNSCEGYGWMNDPNGGTMTCPRCNDENCTTCKGTGEIPEESGKP